MRWKTLDDMDLDGKIVMTRVDINVPLEDGQISDATRIERIVPTIRDILAGGGKPVLLAHFGRPKNAPDPAMSLKILQPALEAALGVPVKFAEDCIGGKAKLAVANLQPGEVLLLENTRFHAGETKNDPLFAASLAALGEIFCNDAFSAAHRAHASTEGIAHLLPSCAGRLMQAELSALEKALGTPARPVGAVVGGAKVSTKLDLLNNLVEKLDVLIIGGGMANTFLMAKGAQLGGSLVEADLLDTARAIMTKAAQSDCRIILPVDGLVAREFKAGAAHDILFLNAETRLEADQMVLDVGAESVSAIVSELSQLKTLVWNGPLGAFEIPPFDSGTVRVADVAAKLTREGGLVSVAGGGDTVSALNHAGVAQDFTYVSTAGGAFLEWMEGKTLPGVAVLES